MPMIEIRRTDEFLVWFMTQDAKTQTIIDSRLSRIETYGDIAFGPPGTGWKYLGDGISELKWKSGIRVYFAKINGVVLLVLAGGNKNGQDQDIKEARKILSRNLAQR